VNHRTLGPAPSPPNTAKIRTTSRSRSSRGDQACSPSPKHSTLEHVQDNARAEELTLDAAEIDAIERAFPIGRRRAGVPML